MLALQQMADGHGGMWIDVLQCCKHYTWTIWCHNAAHTPSDYYLSFNNCTMPIKFSHKEQSLYCMLPPTLQLEKNHTMSRQRCYLRVVALAEMSLTFCAIRQNVSQRGHACTHAFLLSVPGWSRCIKFVCPSCSVIKAHKFNSVSIVQSCSSGPWRSRHCSRDSVVSSGWHLRTWKYMLWFSGGSNHKKTPKLQLRPSGV